MEREYAKPSAVFGEKGSPRRINGGGRERMIIGMINASVCLSFWFLKSIAAFLATHIVYQISRMNAIGKCKKMIWSTAGGKDGFLMNPY